MTTTTNTGLPLLAAEQQQPEVTHNEAIIRLVALHNGVDDFGLNTPTGSEADGYTTVVGASPTGDFAGRANTVAHKTASGWLFFPDRDSSGTIITMGINQFGTLAFDRDTEILKYWNGSTWTGYGGGGIPTSGGTGSVKFLGAEPAEVFEDTSNELAFDYTANGEWQYWTATQAGTVLSVVTANLPVGHMLRMELFDGDVNAPDISAFTPVLNGDTITFDTVTVIFAEKLSDGTVRYIAGGTYAS
jgi:hypothetical protein